MAQLSEIGRGVQSAQMIEEGSSIHNVLFSFDTDFSPGEPLTVRRNLNGLISDTSRITRETTGRSFYIRKLNPIFDMEAINTNLALLDEAQSNAAELLPSYWQPIICHKVRGTQDRVYIDPHGDAWMLMDAVDGTVFNQLTDIPHRERSQVAESLGRGIAVFERMVSIIPENRWRKPLPDHRNMRYHYTYLMDILSGKDVVLNMHRDQTVVHADAEMLTAYSDRIFALCKIIDRCNDIIKSDDGIGEAIVHDDLKINNCIFRKVNGCWELVSLIDLDTVGIGPALIDIADAVRSSGNPAGEQPAHIAMIEPDMDVIETIIDGYLGQTALYGIRLYPPDIRDRIYMEVQRVVYMLGVRFLADACIGNKYFKLKPGEPEDLNLYRAEVQFALLTNLRNKQKK